MDTARRTFVLTFRLSFSFFSFVIIQSKYLFSSHLPFPRRCCPCQTTTRKWAIGRLKSRVYDWNAIPKGDLRPGVTEMYLPFGLVDKRQVTISSIPISQVSHGYTIGGIVVCAVFLALTWTTFLLRWLTRAYFGDLGNDDLSMFVTMVVQPNSKLFKLLIVMM
jgi:hypothetical protein